MTIYLYVKTHNVTGLKYLGKTEQNPFEYIGSGKHWLRHLKVHGKDIHTEIIYETESLDDFAKYAIAYSIEHNIVESKEWANLIIENGSGGDNWTCHTESALAKSMKTRLKNAKTWKQSYETKSLHKETMSNYWNSDKGAKRKNALYEGSLKQFEDNFIGPPKPLSHLVINKAKLKCPHCGKESNVGNAKRWHFDNCRLVP